MHGWMDISIHAYECAMSGHMHAQRMRAPLIFRAKFYHVVLEVSVVQQIVLAHQDFLGEAFLFVLATPFQVSNPLTSSSSVSNGVEGQVEGMLCSLAL
mmetsp:Transcript_5368/g.10532  ORF Transcript_5368/g.10532 Transcript_5368/m.10532 type:complete len:98 (-) Transcript_5368:325-618(-)|eukprot:CAMPEP_0167809088 /NCGR_PEP_ID=MMETSP0111_2-20121227/23587_1 /TAXON_ID=91324 /ORGANISM="Lotharella globosa, Strain CCCM811" /LENGTH=97 /DNA_ID=CAMNT_0007707409 /DNA_START=430 /DNA_END=723 /DNA_ORIENTATION=-